MSEALSIDLVRRYPGGPTVLARAEIPLGDGPVTVLFGPSGAGKTTVLRALAGLDRPEAGSIRFGGEPWFDAARSLHLPPQRRRVGYLPQDHALFPHLTVAENLRFGLSRLRRAEREARVSEIAARLGLSALLGRRPAELSGGQRQRVALGRALAPAPRLLLLDEPLSSLDGPARTELRGELRSRLEGAAIPALLVTHDRVEALALGDRMAVMVEGRIRQMGPVHEVFSAPADAEVARVVGMENVLPVTFRRRENGLAVVAAGQVELLAVDPGGLERDAYACIRSEDIVLEQPPGAPTSARNVLGGVVIGRSDEGPLVRVRLDCGIPLVALVTRTSAEALGLAPGRRAVAMVKTPSVRLVPRSR
ncbi:MAG TPA: ABC transporter ATP-binding protein [Anaeromyxobacter sp.]|nr:ABC transporter ATP-binding protein [Anaeromyxobacter sp.]